MTRRIFPVFSREMVLGLALMLLVESSAVGQAPIPEALDQDELAALEPDQNPPSQTDDKNKTTAAGSQTPDPAKKSKKPKRGRFVIAPIPVSSPALGSGLVFVLGYVFPFSQQDKKSPPSTVGFGAARTNNGSRGWGVAGRLYFDENKYQTTFLVASGTINYNFFGIGRIPGTTSRSVRIEQKGTVFFGEFLRNMWKDIFVGVRYQHRDFSAQVGGVRTPGGFEIPEIDFQAKTVALGFHVQRDKRNSTFYPTKGSLFNLTGDFFGKGLGSKRTYQTYKVAYNGYRAVGEKTVLAYRGMMCAANGSVPFYDLCLYGTQNDLRGYTAGQYQNRRMFATQAEYRRELFWRFGAVAFGGIGGVARQWSDFRSSHLLPAAGVGLRFKLDKKDHINYRIDFAVGRGGHTLNIGVSEAF